LLDLWTAIEFIVSGYSVDKLFSSDEKIKLKDIIENTEFNKNQKNAIKSKIDMLNDPPIMVKMSGICANLGIELNETDKQLLETARKKRNEIIHGKKDPNISESEINKLKSIIEKIILEKVRRMNGLI